MSVFFLTTHPYSTNLLHAAQQTSYLATELSVMALRPFLAPKSNQNLTSKKDDYLDRNQSDDILLQWYKLYPTKISVTFSHFVPQFNANLIC